jgi:hypothetical protein
MLYMNPQAPGQFRLPIGGVAHMTRNLCFLAVLTVLTGTAEAATDKQRIAELEARIKALEASAAQLKVQAEQASAAAEAARVAIDELKIGQDETAAAIADSAAPESAASNGNAFNPAILLVLNASYQSHSLDPANYWRAGFAPVEGAGPETRGLSLGESELSFASNIDDKFYGQMTLAFGDGEVEVEEAYIDTTALPNGLSLRAGRFFSNIGYLNSHHAHTDNFFDRPLAYQSLLANQYGDDGVQLRWVAPTDLFLEVGAEIFAGNGFPAGGGNGNGVGTKTAFAHIGGDVGSNNAWLAGVSVLDADTSGNDEGFSGNSRLYIADATWKWAPQGNFKDGGFTLRGEYMLDKRDGLFTDPADPNITALWNGERQGAYVEGIYRFSRFWESGYRYDRLWADGSGPYASDYDPSRHSVMVTWRNSEFSLFRLQFSQDKPNDTDTDNAIYLQYQTSLGAHGAHKF